MGSIPSSFNLAFVASCHSRVIVLGGGGETKPSKFIKKEHTELTQCPEKSKRDYYTSGQSSNNLPSIFDFFSPWAMWTEIDVIH
jgi:hypothetical protein